LVVGLPEHLSNIDAVGLRELTSRLPGSLLVEDPLHRFQHVAARFCRRESCQRSRLVYHGNNLWHLCFDGLLRALDLFDLLVALFRHGGQVVLKANRAVVRGAVCALLHTILVRHPPRLLFSLAEGVAKIVGRVSLLSGEWTSLGVVQHVGKMNESTFHLSAIRLAMRKRQQILVIRPLITDK
jgi:hypothetical protein